MALASDGGGAGGLETSALAIGQARAALRALRDLAPAPRRPGRADRGPGIGLARTCRRPARRGRGPRGGADGLGDPDPGEPFVLRATQAYLTARKGTGFLRTEPAQRWARQAMFFLVWSCPGPVARAALLDFAGICPA